ncbi:MAG: transposase [Tepidanaerobacteraceae bacterium]|nr:transposase [Tepidanaerobacteraceae bacterium]
MKRRQFSPEFKTKIVLEMLREEKTISEIAADHELSPNQLRNWKKEFLGNAVKVFSESRDARESKANEKELEQDRNDLLAKVGQLTIEVDWLKKKSAEMLGPDYEKRFTKRPF